MAFKVTMSCRMTAVHRVILCWACPSGAEFSSAKRLHRLGLSSGEYLANEACSAVRIASCARPARALPGYVEGLDELARLSSLITDRRTASQADLALV